MTGQREEKVSISQPKKNEASVLLNLNFSSSIASLLHAGNEPNAYYFHADHLGSTSAITDASGSLSQHVLYFAFGETFVEEHRNSTNSPYLYNGKELDEETGRYYYGARYYDPRISLWIGVDPMAGKYPSMSPYNYCANNPVRFLDPDGNEIVDANGEKITYSKENGWSSNATESIKIVHQSLMLTEKGREQWNNAYTSDRKILFDVNTEDTRQVKGQDALGITETPIRRNSTGGVYLDKKK